MKHSLIKGMEIKKGHCIECANFEELQKRWFSYKRMRELDEKNGTILASNGKPLIDEVWGVED